MPVDGRESDAATADLEPCSDTPRNATLLPEEGGGAFAPGLAGKAGGGEAAPGEAGGGVEREFGGIDVTPGGETGCVVDTVAVPPDGAAAPDGCHTGGGDDGEG
jgi:hypothetical protein